MQPRGKPFYLSDGLLLILAKLIVDLFNLQSEVRVGFPSDGGARGALSTGAAIAALAAAARGGSTHHLHSSA